jgi:hypothetical protein
MAAKRRTLSSNIDGDAIQITILIQNGTIDVDGDFEISKSRHQQVLWKIKEPGLHFNIEFTEGTPFAYKQFSDVEAYSGLVRREVLGNPDRYYKYAVTVTAGSAASGYKAVGTLDPGGVVNP